MWLFLTSGGTSAAWNISGVPSLTCETRIRHAARRGHEGCVSVHVPLEHIYNQRMYICDAHGRGGRWGRALVAQLSIDNLVAWLVQGAPEAAGVQILPEFAKRSRKTSENRLARFAHGWIWMKIYIFAMIKGWKRNDGRERKANEVLST